MEDLCATAKGEELYGVGYEDFASSAKKLFHLWRIVPPQFDEVDVREDILQSATVSSFSLRIEPTCVAYCEDKIYVGCATGQVLCYASPPNPNAGLKQPEPGNVEDLLQPRHSQTISCIRVDGKLVCVGAMDGTVILIQKG